ncbi:hypothetical protein ccrud_05060 [Corynebacterium crudilactis]|uniref:NAD(P)-binding domain-containing protein n=1 Tax=Corynebacterium crudilactis TaxID=1652495 RepID=A0A172QSJ4_9CORY|nr:NAD(P)H-binding protein [Corynebacterium crudilactis]ANE03644.1 hypothetical protein ccrud_05060 [Corynebacterium crudilactis]
MKLLIIGGNSGTGALLAEAALAQSHEVTVVSRSGSTTADPRIKQLNGDASDPGFITSAIHGADAVAITVGGSKGVKNARSHVTETVIGAVFPGGW